MQLVDYTNTPVTLDDIKLGVGPGWGNLLENLVADLETLGWNGEVHQVKEKFGGLRFYIGEGSDEIFERIVKAENDSYTLCEECGKSGKARSGGWIKTLCDGCAASR